MRRLLERKELEEEEEGKTKGGWVEIGEGEVPRDIVSLWCRMSHWPHVAKIYVHRVQQCL